MPDLNVGDIIVGRYKIERLIARGGFGDVYLATHLNLKVLRALKVLRRDALGMGDKLYQECSERFKIEAQLGAKLDHPNLVKAQDYGQDGEMQVLAMEYVPGGSLADRLSREPQLPVSEVIRIAIDIASGLAAIHARDVVHRDLKPSNVLFDAQGRARVSDLGLAQLPGGASLRSLNGSQMSSTWHPGTRAYMSPEQENSAEYLKSSSDVYALGVILFEMLTGRNVKNLKAGIRVSELRNDMPSWLDDLVLRMLTREPAQRPADGEEVLNALQVGKAGFQGRTIAPPVQLPPPAKQASRPSSFNKWAFGVIAAVILIVGGAGMAALVATLLSNRTAQLPVSAVTATPQAAGANDRVVEYVVSSANSMLQPLNGISKQKMVRETLAQHWASWSTPKNGAGAALRVFGSQYNAADTQKSCLDTQLLSSPLQMPIPFSDLLNAAQARGLAPLAETLFAAAGDFSSGQKKALVLITDSGDTCGSDPCTWAATQYHDAGLVMPIYVLDLGAKSGLNCLATTSRGKYFAINDQKEFMDALDASIKAVIP